MIHRLFLIANNNRNNYLLAFHLEQRTTDSLGNSIIDRWSKEFSEFSLCLPEFDFPSIHIFFQLTTANRSRVERFPNTSVAVNPIIFENGRFFGVDFQCDFFSICSHGRMQIDEFRMRLSVLK